MKTTTHAETIDPLLARSRQRIQEQLAVDSSDASDEAWSDPEKIKRIGIDELLAHRVAKQAMSGFAPEYPGTTTEFSQIVPIDQVEQIRELEAKAMEASVKSVLPEDYQTRGLKHEPITREQFHVELNGDKPKNTPKLIYDQDDVEVAA